MCIDATEYETFLNPEFALKESEKSLKMLKIKSVLPCKKNWLLVSLDFEEIELELVEAGSVKWIEVNSETAEPEDGSSLDYYLASQLGLDV